jgi:hypothetical protein
MRRSLGDRPGTAYTLANLGPVVRDLGDRERATTLVKESLSIAAEFALRRQIADGLENLADLAARSGDGVRAARLLGAAEALRGALNAPLYPADQNAYAAIVAAARAGLSDEAFVAAWSAGRALSMEQAVAEALETERG